MNDRGGLEFREVAEQYPDVPRFVIRKIDVGLRGVAVSDQAMEKAREANALFEEEVETGGKRVKSYKLGGPTFRDGSTIFAFEHSLVSFGSPTWMRGGIVPYTLDVVDGELMLVDGEEPIEPVYLATIPDYYGKKTSRGSPMHHIVAADPAGCLNLSRALHHRCHFWSEKLPCRYCTFGAQWREEGPAGSPSREDNQGRMTEARLEDIYEAVTEALKEPGRWTSIQMVAGSDPTGSTPYENDVNQYIAVLKTLKRCFGGRRSPLVRVIASAFSEEQLVRLAEAGATAYTPSLEVWDEKLFPRVCPGKAKYFGRQYWIDSAIAAVKVFGRGNVSIQWVGGVEMAQPYGFKSVNEAIASTLEGTEFFARHGVAASLSPLRVEQGSVFYVQEQTPPSLDYCVKLSAGMRDIRKKYALGVDAIDFRRGSRNPDADLNRPDYPDVKV